MARPTKAAKTDDTVPGVHHKHDGRPDFHRLGNLRHDHGEDGRPVFKDPAGNPIPVPDGWPPPEGLGIDEWDVDHPPPDPHGPSDALAAKAFPPSDLEDRQERRGVWTRERAVEAGALKAKLDPDSDQAEAERAEVEPIKGRLPYVQPDGLLPQRIPGNARPMLGNSIGHIGAKVGMEAMYGTPEDVGEEKSHGEMAAMLLFEIANESWGRGRLADAAKLVQVEGILHHMLGARGLLPTPAEQATARDGGGSGDPA